MTRALFGKATVEAGARVRIDTATGTTTPAAITYDGSQPNGILIDHSQLAADGQGGLPQFWGPDGVTTLWRKVLDYTGAVISSTPITGVVPSTGADIGNLGGTYASLARVAPRMSTAAAIGDSIIIAGSAGLPERVGDNFFPLACVRSRQRIRYTGLFGTAGFTLAQIQATHLPSVLAMSPRPTACIVEGGTNDVGAGAGVSFSLAASGATHLAICNSLLAAGIMPICTLIPPRGDGFSAIRANVTIWNSYVARYAAQNGLPVIDMYSPVVDPTSGGYLTAMTSGDQIHPSAAGHSAIADQAIADGLASWFAPSRPLTIRTATESNMVTGGLFLVDTNADGVPDGWSNFSSAGTTCTRPNPVAADKLSGKWAQIARAAGNTGVGLLQQTISTGFAPGDRVQFSGRIQTTGMSAAVTAYWNVELQSLNAGAGVVGLASGMYTSFSDSDGIWLVEFVIPPLTASIKCSLQTGPSTGGAHTANFGEVTARNLTALGIAA